MDKRRRGFTLIEVLTVGAILSLLAGITYPIFVRAKKSANIASDISQMRQVFIALKLYEEDQGEMPPDLTYLPPHYSPIAILHGNGDPRPQGSDGTYPAIMSCSEFLRGPGNCPRVPYMVSYTYLRTFPLEAGITFNDLKTRPDVGLLAALHHADLQNDVAYGPDTDLSGGIFKDSGRFIRLRMDGSAKVLVIKGWGVGQGCSMEECFLK